MFAWLPQAEAVTLINGGVISAAISTAGEQDSYTFSANAGESVQIRVADTSGGALLPRIGLYRPDGALIFFGQSQTVGVISISLPTTGTYTVVVSDNSVNDDQTGTYTLQLSGAGITSVDDPTVGTGGGGNSTQIVPIPEWALALLGVGLLAASLASRKKKRFDG